MKKFRLPFVAAVLVVAVVGWPLLRRQWITHQLAKTSLHWKGDEICFYDDDGDDPSDSDLNRAMPLIRAAAPKKLTLVRWNLSSLDGFGSLDSLEELALNHGGLNGVEALPRLRKLRIDFDGAPYRAVIAPWQRLEEMRMEWGPLEAESFGWFAQFPVLKHLDLGIDHGVRDLTRLGALDQLAELSLDGGSGVRDVSWLAGLTNLRGLRLSGFKNLRSIGPISALSGLEALEISSAWKLGDVEPLAGFTQLRTLKLQGCPALTRLPDTVAWSELEELHLSGCPGLNSLRGLENCGRLRLLTITWCPELRSLDGLPENPALEEIRLESSGIVSLEWLRKTQRLKLLDLKDCAAFAKPTWVGDAFSIPAEIRTAAGYRPEGCRFMFESLEMK